jgi:hypothetical protein
MNLPVVLYLDGVSRPSDPRYSARLRVELRHQHLESAPGRPVQRVRSAHVDATETQGGSQWTQRAKSGDMPLSVATCQTFCATVKVGMNGIPSLQGTGLCNLV